MEQTEKLYFRDSSLLEFPAIVVEVKPSDGGECVAVDKTAFYPTGGGQPNDTGTLGGTRVLDVFEDEAGTIYHTVERAGLFRPGQDVIGVIDRERRRITSTTQRSACILSQAFVSSLWL
jgi:alanyl-tRNA synthetase